MKKRAHTQMHPYNNFKWLRRGGPMCPPFDSAQLSFFSGISIDIFNHSLPLIRRSG